ncbi:MAG: AtpZ/AtpI family protein [Clostridiales bacterium]|nr:AtpZ/AtpI family protein [Clostridiales bacterium]
MRGDRFFTRNKLLKTCLSFGLQLGLSIYLVGVLLGGWLDRKFSTAPWLMLAGILLAIFSSFYQLFKDFGEEAKKEDPPGAVYKPYDEKDGKKEKGGGDGWKKWDDWRKWDDGEE